MVCSSCGCGFRDGERKCPVCGKVVETEESDRLRTKIEFSILSDEAFFPSLPICAKIGAWA